MTTLTKDVRRFITEFQYPISENVVHVHYSALSFAPKGTVLYRAHVSTFLDHRPPVQIPENSSTWSACQAVLSGHINHSKVLHSRLTGNTSFQALMMALSGSGTERPELQLLPTGMKA
jgi:hypothetical protein